MSERPTPADGEHDAWLREALRHAPDADAAPPTRLSAAILSQARAAVAPPAAPHPLLAFWSWLARPPVAAGFASVMAATLVGMMWWDRPLDDAMPAPAAPSVAQAPTTMELPTVPDATEAASRAGTEAMPTGVAPAPPTAALAPTRTPAPGREEKSTAKSASPRADLPTPPTMAPPVTVPTPEARARNEALTAFPAEPLDKSRAAAPAVADAAPPDAPRDQSVAESSRQAPAPRAAPAGRADGDTLSLRRGSVAAPVAPPVAFPVVAPLAPLLGELAAEPAGWTQVGADGRAAAVDPALRRWLGELDAATAGRWTATAASASSPATAATLVLQKGDRTLATLSLSAGSATFESRLDGSIGTWRAELAPATVERLRQGRGRLPP